MEASLGRVDYRVVMNETAAETKLWKFRLLEPQPAYEAVVSCRKLEIHTQQSDVVEIVVRLMWSP